MKEKSTQEKNAAERQVLLITEALSKAADNKGVWLNEQGKQYPRFYPKGAAVSPFNAIVMGLNSDKNGFSTNLYTLFSEAKKRDESVMAHERGVPFNRYAWNKYVNRHTIQRTSLAERTTRNCRLPTRHSTRASTIGRYECCSTSTRPCCH